MISRKDLAGLLRLAADFLDEADGQIARSAPKPIGHPKSHPFKKAERFGDKHRTLAQLTGGIPACIKVTRHGDQFSAKCSVDGFSILPLSYDLMWVDLRVHKDACHPLGGKKEGA